MGFFFAAGEGSGPATFEGDSADAGDQLIMLHQVSIAISNWIHAPKTLEVLGLVALAPIGFLEIVTDYFPVFHSIASIFMTGWISHAAERHD